MEDKTLLLTGQLFAAGLLIFFAFICGRIFRKFRLGESAGQLLGGFLCGSLLPQMGESFFEFSSQWGFLKSSTQQFAEVQKYALDSAVFFLPLYLGVILFSITDETHVERLKENWKLSSINFLMQFALTFTAIFAALRFGLGVELSHAVIAGFIAAGTSPCTAFISFAKRHVEGRFRSVWAQTVTLETLAEVAVVVLMYYFFKPAEFEGLWNIQFIAKSAFVVLVISIVGFWFIKTAVKHSISGDEIMGVKHDEKLLNLLSSDTIPTVNILFVVWAVVAMQVGLALALKVPFMLPVIITGLMMSNFHSQYVFDSLRIQDLMSFFHLIFFAIIGTQLDLSLFADSKVLLLATVYTLVRIVAKFGACYLACHFFDKQKNLKKFLPSLFLPNLGATAIAFMTVHYSLDNGFFNFMQQLVPALIISEFIASPLIVRSIDKWKIMNSKEDESGVDGEHKEVFQVSLESLVHSSVISNLSVRTREDAIKTLCSELLKQGNLNDLQSAIALVLEREKLCSTAIGDEVAIPHCRSTDVDYPMAAVGFMEDGESVDWDAPDELGVRFVFLLISPLNEPNLHIEAMKTISSFVQKEGFLAELRQAAEDGKTVQFLRAL